MNTHHNESMTQGATSQHYKSTQLHSLKHTMEQGSSMRTLLNQVYQVRVDRSPSPTRPSSASSASSASASPSPIPPRTPSPTRAACTPSAAWSPSPTLVPRTPSPTRSTRTPSPTRHGARSSTPSHPSHPSHSTQASNLSHPSHSTNTAQYGNSLAPGRPPSRSGTSQQHTTSPSPTRYSNQTTTTPKRPSSANSKSHSPSPSPSASQDPTTSSHTSKKSPKNTTSPGTARGSRSLISTLALDSEELDNLYFHMGEDGDIIYRLQYLERENKKLTQLLKKGIQARSLAKERESQLRDEVVKGKAREKSYINELETMHTEKKRMVRHIAALEDQIASLENEKKSQPYSYNATEDTLSQLDILPDSSRDRQKEAHTENPRDIQRHTEHDREKDQDKPIDTHTASHPPQLRSLSLVITPQPPSWAAALTPHSPPYVILPPPNFNSTSTTVETPPISTQNDPQLVQSLSQLSVNEKNLLDEITQMTDYASANRTYDALLATPTESEAKPNNANSPSPSSEKVPRKGKDKQKKRFGGFAKGLVGFSKASKRQEAT